MVTCTPVNMVTVKLFFKRSVYSPHPFTNGHGYWSTINKGCFQRILITFFFDLTSLLLLHFLIYKLHHYSAEINIESYSITSSVILHHYFYKIQVLFRVIDFFVINRARKGVIVALEINWAREGVIVALEINWVNLLPRKSSISTQRIVILEGVPRSLETEGCNCWIAFERKSVLSCAGLDVG